MSAVVFDDVSFHYGLGHKTIPVLDGLSIDVAAGTIYGLLGPSGCGKTTLLSCCLGALTPKSGSILLYGEKPHSKGMFSHCSLLFTAF
jgi:ABC-type multidrug transport system ATPase subunit